MSTPAPQLPYRAEIDGLRAVAVLCVLGFHLEATGFGGGFVGVDIFFVISGYLITRLLRDEYRQTGQINITAFYVRRARRLLPALFLVIAVSLSVFALVASSAGMADLAQSAKFAVLSVSNIHFWMETGYFDSAAIAKPLLHTWSLGVEEQFYLVWPLIMLALMTLGRRPRVLIALLGAGSLALNYLFLNGSEIIPAATGFDNGHMTIFYLPPFRLFEFMIGAVLVWTPSPQRQGIALIACLGGLAAIGVSVTAFTDQLAFPSHYALLPCIGTALVIHAGPCAVSRYLLGNPPALFLGRISYALYLVHWPLISLFYMIYFRAPEPMETGLLTLASLILAWLLHVGVEQRFRLKRGASHTPGSRAALINLASCAAIILVTSLHATSRNGWDFRIPEPRQSVAVSGQRSAETEFCGTPSSSALISCVREGVSGRDIYVWGDSHARHLIAGLAQAFPDDGIRIIYTSACQAQSGFAGFLKTFEGQRHLTDRCVQRNKSALEYLAARGPTNVILHSYLQAEQSQDKAWLAASEHLIATLRAQGHRAAILSDVIRPNKPIDACYAVPGLISRDFIARRCDGEPGLTRILRQANLQIEEALPEGYFINVDDAFCGDPVTCPIFLDEMPLFRDNHHLTPYGSQFFILRAKPQLETVLR